MSSPTEKCEAQHEKSLDSSCDKHYESETALVDSNKGMECSFIQKEISDMNGVLTNPAGDHDIPIQTDFNSKGHMESS